jgi:tetratricopeptide (TPR) repeat protein
VTVLAVVVIFGIHSTIDWTWFIPGAAIPALVCAGWLAGRGPLPAPVGRLPRPRGLLEAPLRSATALALCALALLGAWIVWQPQRSADAVSASVNALTAGNAGAALSDARTAVAADPLDLQARGTLSAVYRALGDDRSARQQLVAGTSEQPSNPESWRMLAAFDTATGRAADAQRELVRARALDPSGS